MRVAAAAAGFKYKFKYNTKGVLVNPASVPVLRRDGRIDLRQQPDRRLVRVHKGTTSLCAYQFLDTSQPISRTTTCGRWMSSRSSTCRVRASLEPPVLCGGGWDSKSATVMNSVKDEPAHHGDTQRLDATPHLPPAPIAIGSVPKIAAKVVVVVGRNRGTLPGCKPTRHAVQNLPS